MTDDTSEGAKMGIESVYTSGERLNHSVGMTFGDGSHMRIAWDYYTDKSASPYRIRIARLPRDYTIPPVWYPAGDYPRLMEFLRALEPQIAGRIGGSDASIVGPLVEYLSGYGELGVWLGGQIAGSSPIRAHAPGG